MIVEPMTDAELDGLRSKIFAYNRKERSRLRLFGQNVIRILARLDAERTRADAAEAERDAAVARAMPEPRLLRTVEEVEALPSGDYLIRRHDEMAAAPWRCTRNAPTPWRTVGTGHGNGDLYFIGAWISGPLPDLPTPTAAQEG